MTGVACAGSETDTGTGTGRSGVTGVRVKVDGLRCLQDVHKHRCRQIWYDGDWEEVPG